MRSNSPVLHKDRYHNSNFVVRLVSATLPTPTPGVLLPTSSFLALSCPVFSVALPCSGGFAVLCWDREGHGLHWPSSARLVLPIACTHSLLSELLATNPPPLEERRDLSLGPLRANRPSFQTFQAPPKHPSTCKHQSRSRSRQQKFLPNPVSNFPQARQGLAAPDITICVLHR